MTSPSTLLDALRDAWPHVHTDAGWATRGNVWADDGPVGVMQHHTAPPVPFPVDRLNGSTDGRIKCNINTKPDGSIWLVAFDACNYSSGKGSSAVLDEVRDGTAPAANAADRDLADDTNGNPYFWNFENDHPGDGSPLPDIQEEAIVVATRVSLDVFGLSPSQVISHAEWTARKVDPYWNDDRRAIEEIRAMVSDMAKEPLRDWARPTFKWLIENGYYTEQTDLDKVRETYDFQQQTVMNKRIYDDLVKMIRKPGSTPDTISIEVAGRVLGQ